ncbi:hypothetical protein C1H46_001907 [Malus baccata]|uniref:Uncharacterized protein n=1 Tax=Malus baccata TaxID=106549 RepID=A0A540NNA3_MALBA|nr:hypothetical protein C1H46_001907 [Malus baccata]
MPRATASATSCEWVVLRFSRRWSRCGTSREEGGGGRKVGLGSDGFIRIGLAWVDVFVVEEEEAT